MFDVADRYTGADYDSAAHECALALREDAGIPQFGKRCQGAWERVVDDWMCGN